MSWEGYERSLCEDGHLYENGDTYGDDGPEACTYCGKQWAWRELVDTTNGFCDNEDCACCKRPTELQERLTQVEGEPTRYVIPMRPSPAPVKRYAEDQ